MEFAIKIPTRLSKTASPADWIIAGIKIFGVALLIWIGFSLAKYIAAAVAFIAFNAMAIGLVLAGLGIFITIIKWVLDRTGITMDDVIAFFQQTISYLVNLLTDVMSYLLSYFG